MKNSSSFSLHPPSAHLLQTGQALPDFLCTEARAFIFEFCSKWWRSRASSCPAVLGDVDPCWGVYECVTFTLFALMYIMSKKTKLKFYFEYRKKKKSNQCIVIALIISVILLLPDMFCFDRSVLFCWFARALFFAKHDIA